jgi:hypothetical protein
MAASGGGSAGIFISYRRADASWPARWLADRLAWQFGADVVFQDVDSIQPGDEFAAKVEAAVGACSVLLAVIGPHWLTTQGGAGRRLDDPADWVRLEIEAAIRRGVRIIPILVDGAKMPAADELPPSLQVLTGRQAVTLTPASLNIRTLVSVLETALAQEKRQPQAGTRTPKSPQPARSHKSRLLMSAVNAASTLWDREKVNALAAVVRAAALTAPESIGWLTAEAETAARSIDYAGWRAEALAEVAKAVAAADPERAEAIARSIKDAASRAQALAGVAKAVAAADPKRAEAIARSIDDAFWRSSTLANLARPHTQPD